jgi:hypothetical protein
MTEEYKYGRELNVEHMTHPTSTEDGYLISSSAAEKLGFVVFDSYSDKPKADPVGHAKLDQMAEVTSGVVNVETVHLFGGRFLGVAEQERILRYGSRTAKVVMKRARRHDGDKHTNTSGQFLGEILSFDLKREAMMLRAGMPREARHPKKKSPLRISSAFFSDAAGTVRDIREMDYLNILKSSDQLNQQEFGRFPRAGKDD